jgi:hypothetical protein
VRQGGWDGWVSRHPEHAAWVADHWLAGDRRLPPVPEGFATTRANLHRLGAYVIAPVRHAACGKFGLRWTRGGFGTPFFGDDRQVRVEDGVLVDGDSRTDLGVDKIAARALGDWYGYCTSLLEQLRADATDDDAPARVQLWPEHFDIAVDIGPEGRRANFGGSPGDEDHPEPYLYVGPWAPHQDDDFWNEPFGASLSYAELRAGADGLAFLRKGRELLNG